MRGFHKFLLRSLQLVAVIGTASAFAADDDEVVDNKGVNAASGVTEGFVIVGNMKADNLAIKQGVVINQRNVAIRNVRVQGNFIFLNNNNNGVIEFRAPTPDEQFEQLIFRKVGSPERGRQTLDTEIETAILHLDQICKLTDDQKAKLELAGRIDRKRFFDQMDDVRVKLDGLNVSDENDDVAALQMKAKDGILDLDSFFVKTLRFQLTQEQKMRLSEYRRSKHSESMKMALSDIEKIITLTEPQRDALGQLILELSPTPTEFRRTDLFPDTSDRWATLYKVAARSEQKVKPLLEPDQWETLEPRLRVYLQFKQYLTRKGLIVASVNDDQPNIEELK